MPNPAESVALVDSSKRQRPRVQIPSGAPTHMSGRASARLHLRHPTTPSRQLSHLLQDIPLRLFPIHPPRIHRGLHHLLELPFKRQKLPFDIRAVDTIGIIRVLSPMFLVGRHWHPATLTAQSERH